MTYEPKVHYLRWPTSRFVACGYRTSTVVSSEVADEVDCKRCRESAQLNLRAARYLRI